jgi:hypothetical protein
MVSLSQIKESIVRNPYKHSKISKIIIVEPKYITDILTKVSESKPTPVLVVKEVEKPVMEKVIEKPVMEKVIEKPVMEKVIEKPVMEKVIEKPVMEKVIEKPVGKVIKKYIDPIVLGIEERDMLYFGASSKTMLQMECEEAVRIESLIDTIYSSEGGRSRGWTKKSLETFIKPRCASGGNLYDLEKAKVLFEWSKLFSDKETSAILDFVCLAKNIRIVVWRDEKHFGIWPAADKASLEKPPTLIHIALVKDEKSGVEHGCKTFGSFSSVEKLFEYVDSSDEIGWIPALACTNLLSNKTVDELDEEAKKVKVDVSGLKKIQKIAAIAAKRRRITLGVD